MRILAIRGENLASLAEPFAIEFEQEPLRSAGLFAITGETGAGKSTILDALCLALYDKYPRVVAAGGGEGAPDPSGETLASGDPRAILRRGTGRGFAEADFIARDGRRYRARCDLMRARGRAAGRLQNRGRSLWRLDDAGTVVETLESGVEPVNRRIVELTELTFDQFRRTALLAQGDFDAFLRADARERGDLLEKITGAEIYGRLSMRAFEKAREAREAVAARDRSLREIGVLPDDERAALLARTDAMGATRAALDGSLQEITEQLRRLDAHALAASKLAQAESERGAAAAAFDALGAQRRRLDDLARVAPLRGPREEAMKAERAIAEKQSLAAQAAEQDEAARAALAQAHREEADAAAALEAALEEMAQHAPLWEKANALDTLIATQKAEVTRAQAAEREAVRLAAEKQAELDRARKDESETQAAGEAARQALERLAAARPLSERWAEIDESLSRRAQTNADMRAAGEALRKARHELSHAEETRAAFDRADEADRAALAQLVEQAGEREAARAALEAPEAQQALDDMARAHQALQEMARLAREHDQAQEKAARAREDIARFQHDAEELARRLADLQALRAEQARQDEEASRLGDLADAAAASHALEMRATLEAGQPCPVCGAKEHPFTQSQGAAQALVYALRERREAARLALSETDRRLVQASGRGAQTRALHQDATQRQAEARAAIAAAAHDYETLRAREPHPEAPRSAAGAAETIARLIVEAEARREALRKIIASERQLSADIALFNKQLDDRRAAIDARRAERDAVETRARRAGEECARLEQTFGAATGRLLSVDQSLSSYLILCDLKAEDLDRDPAGCRRLLAESGARFKQAQEALTKSGERLVELGRRIAALEVEARMVAETAASAAADHGERHGALARLQIERGQMLDGEATAPHRARIEERHASVHRAYEAARYARAEADKVKAACDERIAGAARDVEKALAALGTARTAFAGALAATGLRQEEATPLLAIPQEEADALRALVETAQVRLRDAETAMAARRGDLAEAEAAGLPETPRDELDARRAAAAASLAEVLTQIGVVRQQLQQDDEARARAQALSGEIDAARATSRIWEEINAAIGSKDGDRFRRFAQAVTLEQLVALANQRLALLSPRYRLERSGDMGALGLQIVDRDLGDERRSTRSLSGGERFLASLALALALAGLEGRDSFVDTLFIDEGFGALDAMTLDVAIDALETLQGQGRKVGVISHVESMQSRIATKVSVERRGGGVSAVRLLAAGA
ncbi:MAG: AAA family ATPase [Methylocystis sp.]|uniref:AAA family ATPase n=1 Tax=Methylocystis sp. TaxID=1911079 RepID=UPI003DA5A399